MSKCAMGHRCCVQSVLCNLYAGIDHDSWQELCCLLQWELHNTAYCNGPIRHLIDFLSGFLWQLSQILAMDTDTMCHVGLGQQMLHHNAMHLLQELLHYDSIWWDLLSINLCLIFHSLGIFLSGCQACSHSEWMLLFSMEKPWGNHA